MPGPRRSTQVQSTRRWDDERGETTIMRTKEDAHDYRYFPCPDLLPLHTAELIAAARRTRARTAARKARPLCQRRLA